MEDIISKIILLSFLISVGALILASILGPSGRLSMVSKILSLAGIMGLGVLFLTVAIGGPMVKPTMVWQDYIIVVLAGLLAFICLVGGFLLIKNFIQAEPWIIREGTYQFVEIRTRRIGRRRMLKEHKLVMKDDAEKEKIVEISGRAKRRLMAQDPDEYTEVRVEHRGDSDVVRSIFVKRGGEVEVKVC